MNFNYQKLAKVALAKVACRLAHKSSVCMRCASVLFETFAPASNFLNPDAFDFSEQIAAHQFCSRHSARHQIFHIQTSLISQRRSLRISFVRDIRPGIRFFTSRYMFQFPTPLCGTRKHTTKYSKRDFMCRGSGPNGQQRNKREKAMYERFIV